MKPIEFIKQFGNKYYALVVNNNYLIATKYYPKEYRYGAAAIASVIFLLLMVPVDKPTPDLRLAKTKIPTPAPTPRPLTNSELEKYVVIPDISISDTEAAPLHRPDQPDPLPAALISQIRSRDLHELPVRNELPEQAPAELPITNEISELKDLPLLDQLPIPDREIAAITELWQDVVISSGDNISSIFTKVGLSNQDLFRVLNSSEEAKILNRVFPGYQLNFNIPETGRLQQLQLLKSPLEGYLFTLNGNTYDVETILNEPEVIPTFKTGTISDSLFMAGQAEKIPSVTIIEMANIFGGVIDFILDPRAGDEFSILYEEKYLNGEFIGNGDILASQFTNRGQQYTALRYIDAEGDVGYYNADGESMRKAFLRNPLDVFRISSNFNPNRRHPIRNTIRAHKGTDYAAPTGTPIRATGDGRVTWAARNGSFGNLVVLKHTGSFETKYAHLSKYGNGIKKGARVKQGDIIGYVGATGGATGPHLHYEFLIGGVHKNPRTVHEQLPKAVSLQASEIQRFRAQTADLLQHFSQLNNSSLLSVSQSSAE